MSITFRTFCETLQSIREAKGSNTKITVFAECLNRIDDDENLQLAAQFIGEGAFETISGKRASVGSRTSGLAASKFCEIDYDLVFKPCRTATGSNSETIARLMQNIPSAVQKRNPQQLSLTDARNFFEQLYRAKSRAEKEDILWDAWKKMTPVEIKYFIRILSQESLLIGFESRSVVSSIATAFEQKTEEVRYAHMIIGSIGKTALLASQNRLHAAQLQMFQPLSFMLASPVESQAVENLDKYFVEEKFDGMRAQLHADGDQIKVFSRDLNEITRSFPDPVSFFQKKSLPPMVLDGEICMYKNEAIQPFQLLQKRIGLKKPGKKILEQYPAIFIAFDILFADNKPVFDLDLKSRRKILESVSEKFGLPVANQFSVTSSIELEQRFEHALAHGNEGLMLKLQNSRYEYGRRGKSWLKVKKPGGSFDTVVMYAHAGSGKRGGTYSDFTLGISVKEDERYEEEFIPIGKAHGGYTDDELKKMNEKIKDLTVERYGPTLGLLPDLVVEIEFDDIQANKRTKAGYTLRFPRIRAIRWDLGPNDVNTLRDVEEYYQNKLRRERLPQGQNPSFTF